MTGLDPDVLRRALRAGASDPAGASHLDVDAIIRRGRGLRRRRTIAAGAGALCVAAGLAAGGAVLAGGPGSGTTPVTPAGQPSSPRHATVSPPGLPSPTRGAAGVAPPTPQPTSPRAEPARTGGAVTASAASATPFSLTGASPSTLTGAFPAATRQPTSGRDRQPGDP